jgi:eukaryotic-like serine/threonine-protein kinase
MDPKLTARSDSVATVRLKPSHSEPRAQTIETPEQALLHIKAHRIRGLMLQSTYASLIAAVLVLFVLGGDPFAMRLHAYALVGSAALTGAYVLLFSDPRRYSQAAAAVAILAQLFVMLTGYHYWGIFSAYAAVVPVTIFIASDAAEVDLVAYLTAGLCVVLQTAFALATVLDWIPTRSLTDTVRGTLGHEIVGIGLIGVLAFGGVLLGRDAKQRTRTILKNHQRTLRALVQREAQLAEAQAEIAAARRAAEGGPGRFTDSTIGGFRLGDVIGRGAVGDVYAATRLSDGQACAVKLLAGDLRRHPEADSRLQRETAMLLTLDSPHVVRVFAVSATQSDGQPFLAMERLVGVDLAQLIKERAMLSLPEVVDIVNQVARGLDDAHRAGVVHRDLKPQNLFAVGPESARTWKIIDFGMGKWIEGEGSITKGQLVGTPGYMSPEQALGTDVDARSDVYALGAILYRLVTGVPVIRPGDVPAMIHEVVYKQPTRPSQITDVPPQVEAVLAIALAKNPSDRFASAGELAQALDDAVAARLAHSLDHRAARIIAAAPWSSWIHG